MGWFNKNKKDTEIEEKNHFDFPGIEQEAVNAPQTPSEQREKSHTENWLARLTGGLSRSTGKITQGLSDFVTKRKLDQDALDALEEVLIAADLGPHLAARLIDDFARERFGKDVDDLEIRESLAAQIEVLLTPAAASFQINRPEDGSPYVVLVCGVNGAGKTTTIGKLAERLMRDEGKKVMVAAGDTFRAAAVEQLKVWAERSGALFHGKATGADSAAVAFEAYEQACAQGADVLLIDTAGRLQNKTNLMDELQKIVRVLQKKNDTIPHASLLVLDATTGQNALSQVQIFGEIIDLTGLIVTKLDGSAKGGVVVALAQQFDVPVQAIGVGERLEDLQEFNACDYARALMGL